MRLAVVPLLAALAACPAPRPAPRPPTPAPEAPADAAPVAPDPAEVAPPRLERTDIGASGLSAYLPKGFPAFDVAKSDDGADVYTGELAVGDFTFGVIGVKFQAALGGTPDQDEDVLIDYLDFLKQQVGVTDALGYGRGHTLDSEPTARGVIDSWVDADGNHYAVEGWVTDTHLAVLYVLGATDYPSYNVQELYLNGIRFAPAP